MIVQLLSDLSAGLLPLKLFGWNPRVSRCKHTYKIIEMYSKNWKRLIPIDISKHVSEAPCRALHTARSLSFLHRFGQLWERLQGGVAVPRDVDLGDHGDATLLSIAQHLSDVVVAIKAAIPQGDHGFSVTRGNLWIENFEI